MRRKFLRICALMSALSLGARAGASADPVDLLEVDHRLYELGYRDGACSGELNDVMVNALRNFQRANGLGITGEPDAGTTLVLLSDAAVSQDDYLNRLMTENYDAPELSAGASGDEVTRLQRALRDLGYFDGSADGAYGDATTTAVSRFQLANGLRTTGVADGAVTLRLYSESPVRWEDFLRGCVASAGDSGVNVHTIQYWLQRKGYFEGECTGRYGESTQRAVRQFQTDSALEASGDADLATCRAIFADIEGLLREAAALRRGSTSAAVSELYRGLTALGYSAHESFDMQMELAVMQFQRANGLAVTGVADSITLQRLEEPNAVGIAGYVAAVGEEVLEEGFSGRIVRQAARLLGHMSGFDSDFGLVQYAYLKCGAAVVSRSQFTSVNAGLDGAAAGDMMVLELDGREICGVTASDGALIYRAEDGRVLMGYPGQMGADSVRLYRLVVQ